MDAPSDPVEILDYGKEHEPGLGDTDVAEVELVPPNREHVFRKSSTVQPFADMTAESTIEKSSIIESLGDLDKNSEHAENLGEICELHVYETRFNSKGEEVVLQVGAKEDLDLEEIRSPDVALVLMRNYDEFKALMDTTLEIRSPYIKKAMVDVIGEYPGVDIGTSGILKIHGKPRCLFHYRDELYAYAQASDDEDVKEHITYLLRYMRQALRKEIASYETHMDANAENPGLDFDNLWMAFRPGDFLYHTINGEGQVCRLKNIHTQVDSKRPIRYARYWNVQCEIINCDGEDFIYSWDSTSIFTYDGYRSLSDLNIIPLRLHKDQLHIRESLLARGKRFLSLLGVHHRNYRGTARFFKEVDHHDAKYETLEADGRIIVDCEEYASNTDPSISECIQGSKLISGKDKEYEGLCDDEILICSHEVAGFSFQHRRWGLFKVSGLADIEFNHKTFDALVLSQNYKDLLRSLVNAHQNKLSSFDDLVKGKGKGLLFLLHGEPGVGKTLTAESISELTERPLYTIGASELGSYSSTVDRELRRTLKLATKWNAIVLLDEADVFMVERSWDNTRNEMVAVLLRTMEYFEGIMFMTTNRMDSIDTAFASRVHLMLAYPRLGEEARRVVWATFISSTSSSTAPEWLDDKFLDEVAAYEINGRQIKNVTRIACAIAANEKRELAADDIMKGLEASSYMSLQRPEESLQQPPQPVTLRTQYLGCYNFWFHSFGWEIFMVLPTSHVVGPLLAIGVSSILRHGIKLGISAYQRFCR